MQAMRSALLERSSAQYEPVKVLNRSEVGCSSMAIRELMISRANRVASIGREGFQSDLNQVYQPLGVIYLEPLDLVYSALSLTKPPVLQGPTSFELAREVQQRNVSTFKQQKPQSSTSFDRSSSLIARTVKKANERILRTKYGMTLRDSCVVPSCEREKLDSLPVTPTLEFDIDRRTFYHLQGRPKLIEEVNHVVKEESQGRLKMQQMEAKLGIKRPSSYDDIQERYLITTSHIRHLRLSLNNLLKCDLERIDCTRLRNLTSEQRYFDEVNDLLFARKASRREILKEDREVLQKHAWFNELYLICSTDNSVLNLCSHIQYLIIDQVQFTKETYLGLLKLLTTESYISEEIQRVVRFLKVKEPISERDFQLCLELSGHIL